MPCWPLCCEHRAQQTLPVESARTCQRRTRQTAASSRQATVAPKHPREKLKSRREHGLKKLGIDPLVQAPHPVLVDNLDQAVQSAVILWRLPFGRVLFLGSQAGLGNLQRVSRVPIVPKEAIAASVSGGVRVGTAPQRENPVGRRTLPRPWQSPPSQRTQRLKWVSPGSLQELPSLFEAVRTWN